MCYLWLPVITCPAITTTQRLHKFPSRLVMHWKLRVLMMPTLSSLTAAYVAVIYQDANFVVTGGTVGCHNHHLWCHQSQQKVGIMTTLGFQCANVDENQSEIRGACVSYLCPCSSEIINTGLLYLPTAAHRANLREPAGRERLKNQSAW